MSSFRWNGEDGVSDEHRSDIYHSNVVFNVEGPAGGLFVMPEGAEIDPILKFLYTVIRDPLLYGSCCIDERRGRVLKLRRLAFYYCCLVIVHGSDRQVPLKQPRTMTCTYDGNSSADS